MECLIVSPDAFTANYSKVFIDPANSQKLPAVYMERKFTTEGGLISYGPNYIDHFQQAATYVDRILRGEKPADLPVQEPSKFELIINLKTAKVLGLTVSNAMQLLANEIIE